MNIRINITKTGIKKGEPCSATKDPIARAIVAAGLSDPEVQFDTISFTHKGMDHIIDTPLIVRKFIKKFDNLDMGFTRKELKPFSFVIRFTP